MNKRFILATVSALCGFSFSVFASGLSKPVSVGPKAVGMGGAFVGVADDPSAIFHNPAGITQLDGHQFLLGFDGLITDETYTPPALAPENAKAEFIPVPFVFYTTSIVNPVWLGLGLYFPHGNGGKFMSPSAVLTNPNEGRIYSMELTPTVAWQIFKGLSIGAGARIVRISSSLKGQLVSLAPPTTLDDLSLSGWGFGASAGLLWRPCDQFSFGVDYRSKVSATLSGDATFSSAGTPLGTFPSDLDQKLPTFVSAGVSVNPTKAITLAMSYDYERNREITPYTLTVTTVGPFPITDEWHDSHTVHAGFNWAWTDAVSWRLGYAKDLNHSVPDASMNRIIGDIAAHEFSTGLGVTVGRFSLGGTWNARFGTRDVPVTPANLQPGNYDAFIHYVSLALGYRL